MSMWINGKLVTPVLQLVSDENGILGELPLDKEIGDDTRAELNERAIAKFFELSPRDMDITVKCKVKFRTDCRFNQSVDAWIDYIVNCWENKQVIFSYHAGDTDRIYVTLKDSDGTEIEPTSIEQVKEWGE